MTTLITSPMQASSQSSMTSQASAIQNSMNSSLPEVLAGLNNQRVSGASTNGSSLDNVVTSAGVPMSTSQQSIIQQLTTPASAASVGNTPHLPASRAAQLNGQPTTKDVKVSLILYGILLYVIPQHTSINHIFVLAIFLSNLYMYWIDLKMLNQNFYVCPNAKIAEID